MFKIVNNERLSDNMFRVTFEAPLVARKAQPGQFLMFRVDEFGERMPITISSYDREAGTAFEVLKALGHIGELADECHRDQPPFWLCYIRSTRLRKLQPFFVRRPAGFVF